jgi:hypothetical protein
MSTQTMASAQTIRSSIAKLAHTWQFANETVVREHSISKDGVHSSSDTSVAQLISGDKEALPIQLFQAYGWGKTSSVLSITREDFATVLDWSEISASLLEKVPKFTRNVPHYWESEIEQRISKSDASTGAPPAAVSFAFKVDLRRNAYVMALLRYDFRARTIKGVMFESYPPELKQAGWYGRAPFSIVSAIMSENLQSLAQNPLLVVGRVFACLEDRLRLDFGLYCDELLESEGLINVTKRTRDIEKRGFTLGSSEHGEINARLYDSQSDFSQSSSRIEILLNFGNALMTVLHDLDSTSASSQTSQSTPLLTDVTSTLRCLEVDRSELTYAQTRLHSQFAILHNLISQRDSRVNASIAMSCKADSGAMRSISFLTMIFLPTTFVSTIFSTTVFNFQAWPTGGTIATEAPTAFKRSEDERTQRVVSAGWWIYMLCCIILTALTFGGWYIWNRRVERHRDKYEQLEWPPMCGNLDIEKQQHGTFRRSPLSVEGARSSSP